MWSLRFYGNGSQPSAVDVLYRLQWIVLVTQESNRCDGTRIQMKHRILLSLFSRRREHDTVLKNRCCFNQIYFWEREARKQRQHGLIGNFPFFCSRELCKGGEIRVVCRSKLSRSRKSWPSNKSPVSHQQAREICGTPTILDILLQMSLFQQPADVKRITLMGVLSATGCGSLSVSTHEPRLDRGLHQRRAS